MEEEEIKIFTYCCDYCNHRFEITANKDLENIMVKCPKCKNYLKKLSFIKSINKNKR
jgi:predicted nucleic acid-binding Zn ribbon protein